MTDIGSNIAYLRNRLGLSQQQLADYLGVNRVELSYYETGHRQAPTAKLIRLADLAGIDAADLLDPGLTQTELKVHFIFRTEGFDQQDLPVIAEFQRIVKNYLRMKRLSNV